MKISKQIFGEKSCETKIELQTPVWRRLSPAVHIDVPKSGVLDVSILHRISFHGSNISFKHCVPCFVPQRDCVPRYFFLHVFRYVCALFKAVCPELQWSHGGCGVHSSVFWRGQFGPPKMATLHGIFCGSFVVFGGMSVGILGGMPRGMSGRLCWVACWLACPIAHRVACRLECQAACREIRVFSRFVNMTNAEMHQDPCMDSTFRKEQWMSREGQRCSYPVWNGRSDGSAPTVTPKSIPFRLFASCIVCNASFTWG